MEKRLISILSNHEWFVDALFTVKALNLDQWCIGAGVIRNIVFDHIQGISDTKARDVDVAYFDQSDLSKNRDHEYESLLSQLIPTIPWEVTNQVSVHLWYHKVFGYKVDPITSIEDAVSTWPETCTSVAITLTKSNNFRAIAPCGLDDLFNMTIRRNPKRINIKTYNERIQKKQYDRIWKSVQIVRETVS